MEDLRIHDKDHLWYKGIQYVSLNRFLEIKEENIKEMRNLQEKISTLVEENNAYRTILKLNTKEEN